MSIGLFFYLADFLNNLSIVLFLLLMFFLTIISLIGMSAFLDSNNGDIERIRFNKIIKCTWLPLLITIFLLVAIPSKETMYVIGGEKAVYEIVESKENKEVIGLIKKIVIKKLKDISSSVDDAKDGK